MYSARMPTESAWLENVVDLEEAKVPPKQVSQQAFFKSAILWEDQGMFSYPFPSTNKKKNKMGDPGTDLVSHQPLQGNLNNKSGKFEILV